MRVLFVCKGNTCRSPMAEAMLRQEAARRGLPDVHVASAGVECANPGGPANDHAIAAMQARGIDLSTHKQRLFDAADVTQFDLIVALEAAVRDIVIRHVPNADVCLLLDFSACHIGEDVPDPYDQGPDAYRRAVDLIALGIEGLIETRGT